jgi:hypothetical protein
MKAWCAALAAEVSGWPQVEARSFFGFTALYRSDKMFAVLPRTRGMETENALAFKLDTPPPRLRTFLEKDPRIVAFDKDKERWFTFELSSSADLHDVLEWLSRAYTAAGNRRKSK